jgi:hypothetical protein
MSFGINYSMSVNDTLFLGRIIIKIITQQILHPLNTSNTLVLRRKKGLFTCLWTTAFGKVDPISLSVIIVIVPVQAPYRERFRTALFVSEITVVGAMR